MLRLCHLLSALGRHAHRAVVPWAILACLVTAVRGQAWPAAEPRYGTPPAPIGDAGPGTPGEALIAYHRDQAQSSAGEETVQHDDAPQSGPAPEEAVNPLRPNTAPRSQPVALPQQPLLPGNDLTAAPASEPIAVSSTTPPPVAVPAPITEPIVRYDSALEPAAYAADSVVVLPATEETPVDEAPPETRRLAPPSSTGEAEAGLATESSNDKSGPLPFAFSKIKSFSTAGAGLAVVVGLFLICMWLLRRGGGKSSGVLPAEAFAVLGRAPLTAQSFAHLLRVGNKLVLVAISANGAQPLTEVTDPMEVDRITGLCASGRGYGPAAEFQQVLAQLAREPARGFLGGEASGGRRSA